MKMLEFVQAILLFFRRKAATNHEPPTFYKTLDAEDNNGDLLEQSSRFKISNPSLISLPEHIIIENTRPPINCERLSPTSSELPREGENLTLFVKNESSKLPSTSESLELSNTKESSKFLTTSENSKLPTISKGSKLHTASKNSKLSTTSKNPKHPTTSEGSRLSTTSESSKLPTTSENSKLSRKTVKFVNNDEIPNVPSTISDHSKHGAIPKNYYKNEILRLPLKMDILECPPEDQIEKLLSKRKLSKLPPNSKTSNISSKCAQHSQHGAIPKNRTLNEILENPPNGEIEKLPSKNKMPKLPSNGKISELAAMSGNLKLTAMCENSKLPVVYDDLNVAPMSKNLMQSIKNIEFSSDNKRFPVKNSKPSQATNNQKSSSNLIKNNKSDSISTINSINVAKNNTNYADQASFRECSCDSQNDHLKNVVGPDPMPFCEPFYTFSDVFKDPRIETIRNRFMFVYVFAYDKGRLVYEKNGKTFQCTFSTSGGRKIFTENERIKYVAYGGKGLLKIKRIGELDIFLSQHFNGEFVYSFKICDGAYAIRVPDKNKVCGENGYVDFFVELTTDMSNMGCLRSEQSVGYLDALAWEHYNRYFRD